MILWGVNPGYLNRQSLFEEYRELHEIVSIKLYNKKKFSVHSETLKWGQYDEELNNRYKLCAAEMSLRGVREQSLVSMVKYQYLWPKECIDEPIEQFEILKKIYKNKEKGRIPLPQTAQQLWSHHKYSILARDVNLYRKIGKTVARMSSKDDFSNISFLLSEQLRSPPKLGGIRNTVQHMWGHVAKYYNGSKAIVSGWSTQRLLEETQRLAVVVAEPYLMNSTALSELQIWVSI